MAADCQRVHLTYFPVPSVAYCSLKPVVAQYSLDQQTGLCIRYNFIAVQRIFSAKKWAGLYKLSHGKQLILLVEKTAARLRGFRAHLSILFRYYIAEGVEVGLHLIIEGAEHCYRAAQLTGLCGKVSENLKRFVA